VFEPVKGAGYHRAGSDMALAVPLHERSRRLSSVDRDPSREDRGGMEKLLLDLHYE